MTIKVWEVKEGKITSLKHTNAKGENRLIILKEPIAYDNTVIISELGKALDLANTYVASTERIKDDIIDATGIADNEKDSTTHIIDDDRDKKDIEGGKKDTEETEKIDSARSSYRRTENLLRKLKTEVKPGAEVNTYEISKILGLKERNLLYHLNKWIESGDITKVGHSRYKILEKDTSLATPEQIRRDHKDLYGK